MKADILLANRIAAKLRTRDANEIPFEPGFCVEGGFIPLAGDYENIAIGVRFKSFPDVHFSIRASKNLKYLPRGGMLEERMASVAEDASPGHRLWLARITYLRRGQRTLAPWTGEEVLAHLPSQPGVNESHQFQFKSVGEVNNPVHPGIDIELVSGVKENERGAVPPSLNDRQMLELWDALTSTIRLRPITRPAPATVEKKIQLGTALVTGRTCPQTGWWECNDAGITLASRKKFIRAGELMPYIEAMYHASFWQKLLGTPSVVRRSALWELAAYDGAEPALPRSPAGE